MTISGYLRTAVHADFCENIDWQDSHAGSGIDRYDRHGQEQDPRQGGDSARPTAAYICWEAAGRWTDTGGLQHPEGIYNSFGSSAARWLLNFLIRALTCQIASARWPCARCRTRACRRRKSGEQQGAAESMETVRDDDGVASAQTLSALLVLAAPCLCVCLCHWRLFLQLLLSLCLITQCLLGDARRVFLTV